MKIHGLLIGATLGIMTLQGNDEIPSECTFLIDTSPLAQPNDYNAEGENIQDFTLGEYITPIDNIKVPTQEIAAAEPIVLKNAALTVQVEECQATSEMHYYHNEPIFPLYGRVSVEGVGGKECGVESSYGTLGLFLSPCDFKPSCFHSFLDFRAHFLGNGSTAFNIGTGVRFLNPSWNQIVGLNIYYDYLKDHSEFNQVGAGFELLTSCGDFRINGYLPVGHKNCESDHELCTFPGNLWIYGYKTRRVLSGIDAEFEKCCRCLYGAIGGYYYQGREHSNIGGAKIRVGMRFNNYINFELRDTYDNLFHNRFQGVIALNIPFGCGENDCFTSKLVQPVMRSEIIKQDKKHRHWETNY